MRVLVIDVGGSEVKLSIAEGDEHARIETGRRFTPQELVRSTTEATAGWQYDAISLGLPGAVGPQGMTAEPGNLGRGWVDFEFSKAFKKPIRVVNDAVLQALGAYDDGRMLFLGLGTGLGSALVTERVIVPLELGDLFDGKGETLSARLGRQGLERDGQESWQQAVVEAIRVLRRAFLADYVVLGGGNAARVEPLPPETRRGGNDDAVKGGYRLWRESIEPHDREPSAFWRVVQ
jgi:polyphosphate glucokinase